MSKPMPLFEQIAKEAALQMPGIGKEFYAQLERIILAAIERAKQLWLSDRVATGIDIRNQIEAAQPQPPKEEHGDTQEWTRHSVERIIGSITPNTNWYSALQRIADAHNAAIAAAERETVKELQRLWEVEKRAYIRCQDELLKAQAANLRLVEALEAIDALAFNHVKGAIGKAQHIARRALASVKEG